MRYGALLVLSATLPAIASAQGATATVRLNLTVTELVARLHASSIGTDFGTVGSAEFTAGVVDREGPLLSVKSNGPYTVLIAAATATFGPATKPAGEVLWADAPSGSYQPLATIGAVARSGSSGGLTSRQLYFRMLLDFERDPPGEYQLEVRFTLAAP